MYANMPKKVVLFVVKQYAVSTAKIRPYKAVRKVKMKQYARGGGVPS